jgi:hypothetical protein
MNKRGEKTMLEKLYEYREVFEAELVKAQAQVAVVDFMIEAEKKKLEKIADTEIVVDNEVAEQPTDESY